jgi:hypothetical protein
VNTLDELERLLKAGTPGPWKIERGKRCIQGPDTFEGEPLVLASMMGGRQWSASPYSQYCVPGMKDGDANAALIVAAINALPGLLDRVKRLEADMQVIAFGSRIVASADNTLSHVEWTREQLVDFARAALKEQTP